jgi:beta-glucosidase
LVIDTWKLTVSRLSYEHVYLNAGPHTIRLEFFGRWTWGGAKLKAGIVNSSTLVDPAAREMASRADAVMIAVGFDQYSESEGGDRTFMLPPGQDELIRALSEVNKNVIVVITSGGGVDMNRWLDRVPAVMQAWFPGQEGGTALAQLLFGDYGSLWPSSHQH